MLGERRALSEGLVGAPPVAGHQQLPDLFGESGGAGGLAPTGVLVPERAGEAFDHVLGLRRAVTDAGVLEVPAAGLPTRRLTTRENP